MWLLGSDDKWSGAETKCSQTFGEGGYLVSSGLLSLACLLVLFVALKNKSMLSTQGEGCDMVMFQGQMRSQALFGEVRPGHRVDRQQAPLSPGITAGDHLEPKGGQEQMSGAS